MSDNPAHVARQALADALAPARLTREELWLRCFALGTMLDVVELEAYIEGIFEISAHEHNIIAEAVNERLDELGPPKRAPYTEE